MWEGRTFQRAWLTYNNKHTQFRLLEKVNILGRILTIWSEAHGAGALRAYPNTPLLVYFFKCKCIGLEREEQQRTSWQESNSGRCEQLRYMSTH